MKQVDLHTHSYASPDGGLRPEEYRRMLQSGGLDCVAVTDHNTITAAVRLHEELGESIIVGEEISTTDGDVIGLYLTERIQAGLTALQTVERIHQQGGLVYIPHPFERWRHSTGARLLDLLKEHIDIVEIHNGRVIGRRPNSRARAWVEPNGLPGAASSDTHGWAGWGDTYTLLPASPTVQTLPGLLRQAKYHVRRPRIRAVLYPNANRLRKRLGRA